MCEKNYSKVCESRCRKKFRSKLRDLIEGVNVEKSLRSFSKRLVRKLEKQKEFFAENFCCCVYPKSEKSINENTGNNSKHKYAGSYIKAYCEGLLVTFFV